MTKDEMKALIGEVRDNLGRLDGCAMHRFVCLDDRPLTAKYRCECCGGTVDWEARNWYETGLKHGRKDAGVG